MGADFLFLGLRRMGFHRGNETFLMKKERWVVGRKREEVDGEEEGIFL